MEMGRDAMPALFAGVVSPSGDAAKNNNCSLSQTIKFDLLPNPGVFFGDTASMKKEVALSDDFSRWMLGIVEDDEDTWRDKVSTEFLRLIQKHNEEFTYTEGSFQEKKTNVADANGATNYNGMHEEKATITANEATTGTSPTETWTAPAETFEETKEEEATKPKNWKKYSEKDLKSLLNLLNDNEKIKLADSCMGVYSKYNGCPDNALSLPGSYVLGELKHGQNDTFDHALYQLSQYLLLELFWLRAIQRVHTDEVYGFIMMGPNCKGVSTSKYAVVLVRARTPTVLGDEVVVSYWRSEHDLIDLWGYKYVYNFLKYGKRSNWDMIIKEERDRNDQRAPPHHLPVQPSLLYIPNTTLSLLCNEQKDVELVSNGTFAIMLKANSIEGVKMLFDQTAKTKENATLMERLEDLRQEYKDAINTLPHGTFYVKIRTINMNCKWNTKAQARSINSAIGTIGGDLTRLYPIDTYAYETMIFMVMNDMGTLPTRKTLRSLQNTILLFSELATRTIGIARKAQFYHGDALLHNCLLRLGEGGKENLELVDFDEGGYEIAERDAESLPKDLDFRYCRYPDNLMHYYINRAAFGWWYTVVQLSVLFHQLCSFFDDEGKENETVQGVRESLKVIESILSGKPTDPMPLKKTVGSLCNILPVAKA